jgi:hypothetical protein
MLLAAGGEHDDRQMRGLGSAAQAPAELEAGELRQHPVEEEEVRRALFDQRDRLLAVIGLCHREARGLQIVGQQLLQRQLVLDDEDQRLHPSSSCLGRLICLPWIM